ncbi:MAG: hypothetical protein ACMUIM_07190 [bacterium]
MDEIMMDDKTMDHKTMDFLQKKITHTLMNEAGIVSPVFLPGCNQNADK